MDLKILESACENDIYEMIHTLEDLIEYYNSKLKYYTQIRDDLVYYRDNDIGTN